MSVEKVEEEEDRIRQRWGNEKKKNHRQLNIKRWKNINKKSKGLGYGVTYRGRKTREESMSVED